MQLKRSLVITAVAGSIASVAAGQELRQVERVFPMSVVSVRSGKTILPQNQRPPSGGIDVPAVVYDNSPATGGFFFYATGGLPAKCADHISFTPGPGAGGPTQITALNGMGIICAVNSFPAGDVDVLLEFFDTFNQTANPVISGPIASTTITLTLPALAGPGQAAVLDPMTTSIDLTAANIIVPDDDFAVVISLFSPGTTNTLYPTLMPGFNGQPFPPSVGNSLNYFGLDANNNGVFEPPEGQYWFNAPVSGNFYANIMFKFTGDAAGATLGRCCFANGNCQVTTAGGCATGGGIFAGLGTNCATNVCPQPPSGACCTSTGCSITTQPKCLAFVGGVYNGDNSTCAAANCPVPTVLYSNCNVKTGAQTLSGVIINAPEPGSEWSEVARDEVDPLTANTTAGLGGTGALRLADDFVVGPGGMNVGYIRVYAYVTGGTALTASAANLRILDGSPAGTPNVVFGNTTTNRLSGNAFSNIYRAFNTVAPTPLGAPPTCTGPSQLPGLTRHLQYVDIKVGQVLAPGTYWLDFNYTGVNFTPTSTQADAIGRQCNANNSNSLQFAVVAPATTPTWNAIVDAGQCVGAASLSQDLYFEILAPLPSTACYANCDGSTGTPVLTANDFQCFADNFAAQLPAANCDGSTGTPQLTANDFQCFANAFAAGCS